MVDKAGFEKRVEIARIVMTRTETPSIASIIRADR
jgi:hypothetical protein